MIKNERAWLIAWGTLQGFCLLMLHNLVESIAKPGEWFPVLWPLYALALAFPLSMQMLSAYRERRALWLLNIAYSAMIAICAAYAGKVSWVDGLPNSYLWDATFLVGGIVFTSWFVLIPFAEHRLKLATWSNDYAMLCMAAWRNVIKLGSAALFVGIFWILLGLWAGLFKVLGVSFFLDLFTSRTFVYPITAIAFGLGLSLYSAKEEALLGLYRATLNLLGWLLPLVSGIILLFLLVLPMQGVGLLWKTGYATALVLSLLALMVFLFNAAWQDGVHGIKFPNWIRRMVTLTLIVLPILSGICAYALWLRVGQYGWTADRVWAAILIGLLAFYAVGYALSALARKGEWMQTVSKVNVYAAWAIALVLLLTATPVLDPVRISVSSQVHKLLKEKVDVNSFDFQYLRFDGGYYGHRALTRLSVLESHPESAAIQLKAKKALESTYRNHYRNRTAHERDRESWQKKLELFPKESSLTPEFLDYLWQATEDDKMWIDCLKNKDRCTVLQLDLNRDGQQEVLIFSEYNAHVFTQDARQWQLGGVLRFSGPAKLSAAKIRKMIEDGEFSVVESRWQELQLGEQRYSVQPN
ncbi:hypothetical protein MTYP_00348 [Methylophilaceae bacterium]|nr:hypothetical protein MTYP_00348 [Methylophilaceae bacterium]